MKTPISGLSVEEFDNEKEGNLLQWRIVKNEYQAQKGNPALFVYRRRDRGDGLNISEFLHTNGLVDLGAGFDGWFNDWAEIGTAMIKYQALVEQNGHGYAENHRLYMARFQQVA